MKRNRFVMAICCLTFGGLAQAQLLDHSSVTIVTTSQNTSQLTAPPPDANVNLQYKLLNTVKMDMQRMLRSKDGQYFLQLNTGVLNPKAQLSFINIEREIYFKGGQQGNLLNLSSWAEEMADQSTGEYQLNGTLDPMSGGLNAQFLQRGLAPATIEFEPIFRTDDKPTFEFRYLTQEHSGNNQINRIDVIDKASNQVLQSLTGFSADAQVVYYMDVNYDGYYDLVLKDSQAAANPSEQAYIYLMYNPKTQRFQHSTHMTKLKGFPQLKGKNHQIIFGGKRAYQVASGLLHAI